MLKLDISYDGVMQIKVKEISVLFRIDRKNVSTRTLILAS